LGQTARSSSGGRSSYSYVRISVLAKENESDEGWLEKTGSPRSGLLHRWRIQKDGLSTVILEFEDRMISYHFLAADLVENGNLVKFDVEIGTTEKKNCYIGFTLRIPMPLQDRVRKMTTFLPKSDDSQILTRPVHDEASGASF
jgi:hypothetical protein